MAEPTLERGSEGDDVKDLQEGLIELDFKPGAADGVFGLFTESATRSFQTWAQLTPDGICGPLTWEKFDDADKRDPTLREGDERIAVRGLQRRLLAAEARPRPPADRRPDVCSGRARSRIRVAAVYA